MLLVRDWRMPRAHSLRTERSDTATKLSRRVSADGAEVTWRRHGGPRAAMSTVTSLVAACRVVTTVTLRGADVETAQDYYRGHGAMSAPGSRAAELRGLPPDIGSLCEIVQGVLIHRDLAPRLYDRKLSDAERDVANLRPVAEMLSYVEALDRHPLTERRAPNRRMPCTCRHFATLLCSALREQGVPARARCGFGGYFVPGRFEDHWVAEYWDVSQETWVLVDAQLDAVQRASFALDFNPLDVPRDRFIVAGDAWRMSRTGRADPELFGLSFIDEHGSWWIAQNLIRDLAALNRVEMLAWDVWGMMPKPTSKVGGVELALLDRIAELTLAGDVALAQLRELYRDERLRVPNTIFNASRQARETIEI
jgi:hypothetical protein